MDPAYLKTFSSDFIEIIIDMVNGSKLKFTKADGWVYFFGDAFFGVHKNEGTHIAFHYIPLSNINILNVNRAITGKK